MSDRADTYTTAFPVAVGSQTIELPIVPLADDFAIALLMTIDAPISFVDAASIELAERLASTQPDVVVTAATLGIPVGSGVARALGQDRCCVLQKTQKAHLREALVEPLSSITTDGEQALRLDRAWLPDLAGARVVLVDDVISSGGSIVAAMRLLRRADAEVVGVGSLLAEGTGWRAALGDDAGLVTNLGTIPLFRPSPDGDGWIADWS